MNNITKIIIHCSATTPAQDIGVAEIRRWHTTPTPRGNGWADIGYHYVIRRDGTVEQGRPGTLSGAHCKGQNSHSLGICLVGGICGGKTCDHEHEIFDSGQRGKPENNYTPLQMQALVGLVKTLVDIHPAATIHGHNEFAPKACPCFSVRDWWESVR